MADVREDDIVEAILAAEAEAKVKATAKAKTKAGTKAGTKRPRDGEGDGGADETETDALASLLSKSIGFPMRADSRTFRLNGPRLRNATGHACPGASAIGGVYWIHKDAAAAIAAAHNNGVRPGDAAGETESEPETESETEPEPEPKRSRTNAPSVLLKGKGKGKDKRNTRTAEWYEDAPWFAQLTVQPKASGMNPRPPPPFTVWYKHAAPDKAADWIGVPRFFGLSHFGAPLKDVRTNGAPMAPGIVFDPEKKRPFRPEQEAAFTALMASLHTWGGGFVEADCGFGKTGLIIRVLLALGVRGAIVCTQEVLMRQMLYDIVGKPWTWADLNEVDGAEARGAVCPVTGADLTHAQPADLARAFCIEGAKRKCARLASKAGYLAWLAVSAGEREPCPKCGGHLGPAPAWDVPSPPKHGWAPAARVGWLQGAYLDKRGRVSKTCRVVNTDIVLVSAASAAQCDYPWASFDIGALAFDEAHRVASPTISQVAPKLACRYVFGVSATPTRLDGSEHAIYWLLGPAAFVYKRTAAVTGLRGTVRVRQITYTKGDTREVVYRDGRLGFATMVNTLTLDAERNKLILALAADAVRQGRRKILVITSTILHAVLLARALKAQGFFDTTVLRGGVKPATVAYAQNPLCRLVVATYAFLAEGFDDPYIDTMILATPRSSVQQAVGRCERTMDGKLVPLVYDIVDPFSAFAGMAWKRHKFYKSRAFAIARESDDAARARMGKEKVAEADEVVPDVDVADAVIDTPDELDNELDADVGEGVGEGVEGIDEEDVE